MRYLYHPRAIRLLQLRNQVIVLCHGNEKLYTHIRILVRERIAFCVHTNDVIYFSYYRKLSYGTVMS